MRSWWTLGILALLLGLQMVSFNLPWYTFSHSTGRTLPPEYPGNETGENVTHREYYPFGLRGDVNETQVAAVRDETNWLGMGLGATILLAGVAFAIELFFANKEWSRWAGVGLSAAGILVTAGLLVLVWFHFHTTLAAEGVTATFTNRQVKTGFIRSTLGWGWVVGGITVLTYFAHLAFRYQQGAFDLGFVERFRGRGA